MISALISRLVILTFGLLYPAYGSYKTVKNKDIKLYVSWMMYWIVFALFTAIETFTDIFFSFWFPFYYELKIIIVIWLLSPLTKGSSLVYRKCIHPLFLRREKDIDELIAKAKDQGYNVILDIGSKGMNLATTAIMNTAVKGSTGLLLQLKKSYSLGDLREDENFNSRMKYNSLKQNSCDQNFCSQKDDIDKGLSIKNNIQDQLLEISNRYQLSAYSDKMPLSINTKLANGECKSLKRDAIQPVHHHIFTSQNSVPTFTQTQQLRLRRQSYNQLPTPLITYSANTINANVDIDKVRTVQNKAKSIKRFAS